MKKDRISYEYSSDGVKASVLRTAKSIRMQEGWAKTISEKVVKGINNWIKNREIITEDDLRFAVANELDKYSTDLAFAYRNHDKII